MTQKQKKLIDLLREMFQLDQSDLDFGIYRIMNAKAKEIEEFLQNDLMDSIKEAFADSSNAKLEAELEKAIEGAKAAGFDPDESPKVKELKAQLESLNPSEALENDIYSHFVTFFSRYYKDGDFISLRRYKKDTYAIPYEGEEVKLYWANFDQYYIKTSEYFKDYAFKAKAEGLIDEEKTIHFKLVEADVESNNNKATSDKERRFVLHEEKPLEVIDGEFYIYFEYRSVGKVQQKKLNEKTVEAIFAQKGFNDYLELLKTPAPTDKNKDRTLLEKHLSSYTARNTFDYFIHKDLGGFLHRELDFYIKNAMLHIDDIEKIDTAKLEEVMGKVKTFKTVAKKIIAFLTQLEEFQKKLWLKKKFVIETNYCITLDRIPEDFYEEILNNEVQLAEWKRLYGVDADSVETLKEEKYLVLDTKFFDREFKDRLLETFDDLDEAIDGVLVKSENFGALNLMQERYGEQVKCIYIDPPYNTGGNDFLYKDSYRNSSWMTMLHDRITLLGRLMRQDGVFFSSIDDKDDENRVSHRLMQLTEDIFGKKNYLDNLIWVKNTTHNDAKTFSHNHEYILSFAKNRDQAAEEHTMFRQNKPGFSEAMELVHRLQPHYPPIEEIEKSLRELYRKKSEAYKESVLAQGLEWNDETKRNDPWKGIKQYKYVEYRLEDGTWVDEKEAKEKKAKIWIYREDNPSWPNASSLTAEHKDPNSDDYRFYHPIHPITGKPCPAPKRGWLWRQHPNPDKPDTLSFEELDKKHLIAYGEDEKKIPQIKRFLHRVDTDVVKSVITDFTDGEKELANIMGARGTFPNPKPTTVLQKLLEITTKERDIVTDCFVGSGSTFHALLKQNFIDEKRRRYLFIEMGEYFETILMPRAKRIIYSLNWKDGKPQDKEGISHMFKYICLESYEDTLGNLAFDRTETQNKVLASNDRLKEDYLLHYMLDFETKGSLLDIDKFASPYGYTLDVATGSVGETKSVAVDLVETFNYLLGLRVKTRRTIRGFLVIEGLNPRGEKILVIWRDGQSNDKLNAFFEKMDGSVFDREFDTIYINGDNNLANLRKDDEHFKVKLIEEEFKRLMFDE
ncbi:site-specific DNA-methyltransferase [Hydrogenimonas sp.]